MIYVVGGTGFVGSAFVRLFEKTGVDYRALTRSNQADLKGSSCDVLINANGNSKKFLADKDPLTDFDASIRSVLEMLCHVNASHYVYLSSGDVYPDPSCPAVTEESQVIDPTGQSRYGLHKYLAEQLVINGHPSWLILRLGGMVGPGLKKNAVFDILTHSPVWLTPDSELQFISTDSVARIASSLVSANIRREIINLTGRGVVRLADIHHLANSRSEFRHDAKHIRYELSLGKLDRLAQMEIPDSRSEVLSFLRSWGRQE